MSSLVLILAVGCVVLGVAGVERGPNRSKELALIAALAAAAAGGRVLFAFVPNVQPVTIIVAVTGADAGPARRHRGRRLGRAAVECVPRPGPVDALADDRLGPGRRAPLDCSGGCSVTGRR